MIYFFIFNFFLLGEKDRWELCKDAACGLEQAEPHKIAVVHPLIFYHTNPSKMSQTC